MNYKLIKKKEYLVKNIPELIKRFNYRRGPDLYFYKKIISKIRECSLESLLEKNDFIELLYITLASWDMNTRGAKMKYFDEFKRSVLRNKDYFLRLSEYKLDEINEGDFLEVREVLGKLYDNLDVMQSKGKLVSNSKVMHYLLPDLVMPMDRKNTLNFFFGNTNESREKFLDIIECTYYVAKEINLNKFLNKYNEWNLSVPKIIDNAIICEESLKYRKSKKSEN